MKASVSRERAEACLVDDTYKGPYTTRAIVHVVTITLQAKSLAAGYPPRTTWDSGLSTHEDSVASAAGRQKSGAKLDGCDLGPSNWRHSEYPGLRQAMAAPKGASRREKTGMFCLNEAGMSVCKFCTRVVHWQGGVPYDDKGDHRERCSELRPEHREQVKNKNHERQVREFLAAATSKTRTR